MAATDDRRPAPDFVAAVDEFKTAARRLAEAWEAERPGPAPEVTGYPEYLPSFDEFVANLADLKAVA